MELDRAGKFGLIGAAGVVLVLLGTAAMGWVVWESRTAGYEGRALGIVAMVGVGGAVVTVMFLFLVIGEFVDRKLEARGVGSADE